MRGVGLGKVCNREAREYICNFYIKNNQWSVRAKPTVNVWFGGVSWQKPLENTLYVEFKESSPQYGRGSFFFHHQGMLAINSTIREKEKENARVKDRNGFLKMSFIQAV